MRIRLASMVAVAALAGACDGGEPMVDAGPPVALPPPIEVYLEGADEFEPSTLDLSCLGTRTAPTGGAPVDVEFQLRDFSDDFEVPDITVWVFTDNVIAQDCGGPNCQEIVSDASGNARVMMPAGGWYSYQVFPREDPSSRRNTVFGVFQYNEPAPASAGGSVTGTSVSGVTIELIPATLGFSREPGRAIVAGRIHDCNDANIANARVRMYDPDGNFVMEGPSASDPSYAYFAGVVLGNTPNSLATESAPDGLYVVPQVPIVDERPYRVEAWANVDGELVKVGCETARIFPDNVTVLNVGPLRADGAAECMD